MIMFEEQLSVIVPDSFHEMALNRVNDMYPYEEKPQVILEDENRHRFCTFSLFEDRELVDTQTEHAIQLILEVVLSLYPSALLDEAQVRNCKGGVYGWFSYKSMGNKGEIFNVMYIFPLNGCMMFGTMGCAVEDEEGKEELMNMMDSLQAVRKKFSYTIAGRKSENHKI
ncbi:MAG: hypothetical protein K2J99_17025 [Lachnospiraceae bacterium]|nr:hypothetical protein [Lachnospiraceae bacterium]